MVAIQCIAATLENAILGYIHRLNLAKEIIIGLLLLHSFHFFFFFNVSWALGIKELYKYSTSGRWPQSHLFSALWPAVSFWITHYLPSQDLDKATKYFRERIIASLSFIKVLWHLDRYTHTYMHKSYQLTL